MAKNTTSHRFRLDLIIARDGDEVNEEHQPTNTNGSKPRIVEGRQGQITPNGMQMSGGERREPSAPWRLVDKQRNVAGIMVACPIEVSIV